MQNNTRTYIILHLSTTVQEKKPNQSHENKIPNLSQKLIEDKKIGKNFTSFANLMNNLKSDL